MLRSTATFASSSDRLAKVIDEMPDSELLQSSLSNMRATLTESSSLLQNLRGVITEMNQTIGGTDRVLAPFQTPMPAVGGGPPERRFDVAQYTELMRELGKTVAGMNELLGNGSTLVTSPELSGKLNEAGRGVGHVGERDSTAGLTGHFGDAWPWSRSSLRFSSSTAQQPIGYVVGTRELST